MDNVVTFPPNTEAVVEEIDQRQDGTNKYAITMYIGDIDNRIFYLAIVGDTEIKKIE